MNPFCQVIKDVIRENVVFVAYTLFLQRVLCMLK